MVNFGGVPVGSVLPVLFDSFAGATGASITITGLAVTDIEIYKDTSMTQRASDAGYVLLDTDGIDLDGITGIQGFSINTGDNTTAGFYAVGSFFSVIVSAVTVDAQTVNFLAATFRLMAAETMPGFPAVDVAYIVGSATDVGTIPASIEAILMDTGTTLEARIPGALVGGRMDASVGAMAANVITAAATAADFSTEVNTAPLAILGTPAGASMSADIAAIEAQTDDIGAAGAGLTALASAANLATVDTVVDAILVDTGTTLDGRIPAALTAGGNMKADVLAISSSTAAADALEESTEAIAYGTVDGTGATTTVFLSSALTPDSAVNDQFNGRVMIFKADTTTAALRGQATTISDYAHTSAEIGTFTVTALTTAPQTGDSFAIL